MKQIHLAQINLEREETMKKEFEEVGEIGMDSGICWVGDPCYCVTPDATEHPAETWKEFCDMVSAKGVKGVTQFDYKLGHPGLGVCVETGHGDSIYPVFVRRNKEGRIVELRILFSWDE